MEDWIIKTSDPELVQQLVAEHGLTAVAAQCLINRGITDPSEIRLHLNGRLSDFLDPSKIPGVPEAVAILHDAIEHEKRIVLFGDYDVDGMTSCAILSLFLKHCGLDVDVHIPDRTMEDYGLSLEALKKIHAIGADIVVALDNGTSALQELQWAADHGIKMIVVDHHEGPSEMPPCAALVNPIHAYSEGPEKNLCSAGLVFNLVVALRVRLRESDFYSDRLEPNLKELLDLACLGTIADMVPLLGQNRLLVRYGLRILEEALRPGVEALKYVSSLQEKTIGTYEVGFQLAPRLNAAGRMADACLGLRLLTTQDRREAEKLATQLDTLNQERRAIEGQMLEEALQKVAEQPEALKRVAIVVASESWHPGVMGIVASRLTEHFKRPAVVIALQGETGKGSARSFGGINLFEVLNACSKHLLRCGGHKAAAGLTIKTDQLLPFMETLQEVITSRLPPQGLRATLYIDQLLKTSDISPEMIDDMNCLAPFGVGYPAPLFVTEPVQLSSPRVVGKGHLKVKVVGRDREWPAIGFGLAERYEAMSDSDSFEIAYRPAWNEFRGEKVIQLNIKSIRGLKA